MKHFIYSVAKKYPIKLPNGEYTKFADGATITKVKVMFGLGSDREIRDKAFLESDYRIPQDLWSKCRGESRIIVNGEVHRVELHWYEANGRRYEFKMKYDFDERGEDEC